LILKGQEKLLERTNFEWNAAIVDELRVIKSTLSVILHYFKLTQGAI
jgi:hypothetical protein